MTIKLLLLKSGEDIIADTTEMTVGEDEDRRVVGYFLNKPCVCLLYTSPSPRDQRGSRMPSSA